MAELKITGIIPARYGSTRLPGKVLLPVGDAPMIVNVYRQAIQSARLTDLWVATDDIRIFNAIKNIGGKVMMTDPRHLSGTDRCAEVADILQTDYIINIQGDEPMIQPAQIDELAAVCEGSVGIATLIKKISNSFELFNDSIIKVVKNQENNALYFSRYAIPFSRDRALSHDLISQLPYWRHIGIYAYKKDTLLQLSKIPESDLEKCEKLEQLRWLENGFDIKLVETNYDSISIDTPDDYEKLMNSMLNEKV